MKPVSWQCRLPNRLALLACACAAIWGAATTHPILAANEPSAVDVLKAHELQRVGRTWCLPEETDLRQQLVGLDRAEQRLVGAQQAVDQLIGQNERLRSQIVQLQQLANNCRAAMASGNPNIAQRAGLEAQAKGADAAVAQLQRQDIPSARLGLSNPLKLALADLVAVRTDLTIRILPIREAMERLTQSYDALHRDRSITAALKSTSPPGLLGPAKSLRDGWKTVEKLQPMLFSDALPVCRESSFYRVTAIVNERQPLTFSYMGTGQQTLIPQNLAEAAGLTIDAKAAKIKLRVASGREESAWRIRIPQLRFGGHVLRDVEAFILAPEAADIGARIGATAFAGYHVQLDADHLLLVVGGGK